MALSRYRSQSRFALNESCRSRLDANFTTRRSDRGRSELAQMKFATLAWDSGIAPLSIALVARHSHSIAHLCQGSIH